MFNLVYIYKLSIKSKKRYSLKEDRLLKYNSKLVILELNYIALINTTYSSLAIAHLSKLKIRSLIKEYYY